MRLELLLPKFALGRSIECKRIGARFDPGSPQQLIKGSDLLASDWELVDEPAPHDWKECKADYLAAIASCNSAIARLEREVADARDKFTSLKGSYDQLHAAATQNKKVLDDVEALAKRLA